MPVGVDLSQIAVDRRPASDPSRSVRLLFNQRWDGDKRPQRVVAALASAAAAGARFEVVLAGEQPPDDDRGLLSACERLGQRVVHAGTATRSRYLELLHTCDAVVGDPLHEFFGVAAVEAMAAGCHPLLPQALSYPELVDHPQRLLHRSHDLVAQIIAFCADPPAPDATLAAHVRRFDWSRIGPLYDEAIAGLAR